jgi:hypothetical protein
MRPAHLKGPTIPENEQEPPKLDFDATWEREPFIAMSKVLKIGLKGNPIKEKNGKAEQYENEIREKGRANTDWLRKEKLTPDSKPHEWFEALLPVNKRPHDPPSAISIAQWTSYTNLRATTCNAGTPSLYPTWTRFEPQEFQKFIALYIHQGLNPSPQVSMKFRPASDDPIQGSDLCAKVFGRDAKRRHQQWKAFATLQNPLKQVPQEKPILTSKWTPSLRTCKEFFWTPGI